MMPLTGSLRFIALALCCLFSGLTVTANTGRGFILLALPVIALLALVHLRTCGAYRRRWLLGVAGFLLLTTLNGSRPGSVVLVLLGLVLFESMRESRRGRDITVTDLRWLAWVAMLMAVLAAVDLMAGRVMGLWVVYAWHETPLVNMPRLKLFFSEPSYLGVFCVAAFFRLRGHVGFQALMLLVLALTHSLFAGVYFVVLLLRRQALLLLGLFLASVLAVAGAALEAPELFFQSSGLIRLVGLTQLAQIDGAALWLGHGLGAGDSALEVLFNDFGLETANGFLFSLFYDLGLLGMLCLYLAYARRLFDAVHLTLLLLNFGIGSFLLPVLMAMNASHSTAPAASRLAPNALLRRHERVPGA